MNHMESLAHRIGVLLLTGLAAAMAPASVAADPVPVRFAEGVVHGFLVLRTLDGTAIATGDLIQVSRGGRVTARLVFRFKDGSLHDETAVFSQQGHFKLISDRVIQKGKTFKRPLEMSIDCVKGQVSVRYTEEDGDVKTEVEQMEIPADLSNGLMLTLLKNVKPATPSVVSMIAATPKPMKVKLEITSAGEEPFSFAGSGRKAIHYVVHVDIGGIKGLLADLLGKDPPDTHVWILGGEAPAFVKSEGPLFPGGPSWRIELAAPVWKK
jgi:hypothetical protein